MIPSGVQVFVALEPIDMRWSFDRLAGAALECIGYDARSGALFIYFGRRRDAVKVLFFDGSGMCLFYKRLEKGRFAAVYERAKDGVLQMTPTELQLFIEGSDAVGRVDLSPPLLTLRDLTPRWPEKKSLRPEKS